MSRIIALSLALLSLASLAACGKDNADPGRQIAFQTWGKDFTIRKASDVPASLRALGKAVAQVRYARGGSGTAFFVSPDGLFITNHHVMSREVCSESRCGGVQLVRDLAPGGDFQVFSRFRIIAQSEELDFTIGKVELPADGAVPYLRLSRLGMDDVAARKKKLVVIGHPAGSALRMTDVDFYAFAGDMFQLRGPVFWGNSGSPLIDQDSGEVVGLISNLSFSPSSMDVGGNLSILNEALRMNVLIEAVEALYPRALSHKELRASAFDPNERSSDLRARKALAPLTTEEFAAMPEISMETFMGQFAGQPNESEGIDRLLTRLEKSVRPYPAFESAVYELATISRRSGRDLTLTGNQASRFQRALNERDPSTTADDQTFVRLLFEVLTGKTSQISCLNNRIIDESPWLESQICLSATSRTGVDLMDVLARHEDSILDTSDPALYQRRLKSVLSLVATRIDVGALASA